MLKDNFCEKYATNTLETIPFENDFTDLIYSFININSLNLLLIGEDKFIKCMIIDSIINHLNVGENDILYLNNVKDQGINNIRYEIKTFSQSSCVKGKKILIIDDIQSYAEVTQNIFINYIDKWSKNMHVLITTDNIYNVNEMLVTRLFPLNTPSIETSILVSLIDTICSKENIYLTQEMRDYITLISENNLQNIYNILEKCKLLQSDMCLTLDLVKQLCTFIQYNDLIKYFNLLKEDKNKEAYNILLYLNENGHSVIDILNELNIFIKSTHILSEKEKYQCCKIISEYIVTFITIHEEEIELLFLTQDISEIFK